MSANQKLSDIENTQKQQMQTHSIKQNQDMQFQEQFIHLMHPDLNDSYNQIKTSLYIQLSYQQTTKTHQQNEKSIPHEDKNSLVMLLLQDKKHRRQKQRQKKQLVIQQQMDNKIEVESVKQSRKIQEIKIERVESSESFGQDKLENQVIEVLTNRIVQTIIHQFCNKLSSKCQKQKIFMNKPIITKPQQNQTQTKQWLKQQHEQSPQFSLKSSQPKSLMGVSQKSNYNNRHKSSNQNIKAKQSQQQVQKHNVNNGNHIQLQNQQQQPGHPSDDMQSAISFTTNNSQFLNPFTLNSKLNPPYKKQISSSSQNRAQQKTKNPFTQHSNDNSLSTNTGQGAFGVDTGYLTGSRQQIKIEELSNSQNNNNSLMKQNMIQNGNNLRQQLPQKKDSILTIRKFKTQREKEMRESGRAQGEVDISVDEGKMNSAHKYNKINSLNEVESQLSEDEDETGSLTESPVDMRKQKINQQINSNLLKVNNNKNKNNRLLSSDVNSTSQYDASNNKFKLSISSMEEHLKQGKQQQKQQHPKAQPLHHHNIQNQKQMISSNIRGSKMLPPTKQTGKNKSSHSKQFQIPLVSESEDDYQKRSFYLTNLQDDISVIMQTQNEDDMLSMEKEDQEHQMQQQSMSFSHVRQHHKNQFEISKSGDRQQRFIKSVYNQKFVQPLRQQQIKSIRDSTQNIKQLRSSKLKNIRASPQSQYNNENQQQNNNIKHNKIQSESRKFIPDHNKHNSLLNHDQSILTQRELAKQRQKGSDGQFFYSRHQITNSKKNEEVLRIYREANEQMFRQTGFNFNNHNHNNSSFNDGAPTINISHKLRKSNDLFHGHRRTLYGGSIHDSSNNSTKHSQYPNTSTTGGFKNHSGVQNLVTQRTQHSHQTDNQLNNNILPLVNKQESINNNYQTEVDKSRDRIQFFDQQSTKLPQQLRESHKRLQQLMKIEESQHLSNINHANKFNNQNVSQDYMFNRTKQGFKNAAKLIYKIDKNDMLDKILMQKSSPQKNPLHTQQQNNQHIPSINNQQQNLQYQQYQYQQQQRQNKYNLYRERAPIDNHSNNTTQIY